MSKVKISVIITCYNKALYIRQAVESVVQQDYENMEIIVVDDDSTDGGVEILRGVVQEYPQVKVVFNEKNLGVTKNWARACKLATGKYIARLDGDDYWIDNKKLSKQVEILEKNPEYGQCYTDYDILYPDGEIKHAVASNFVFARPENFAMHLVMMTTTMPGSWLVRTDLMRKINGEIDLDTVDDTFDIQLELYAQTKVYYLDEVTVTYRFLTESDSKSEDDQKMKGRMERLREAQWKYIEKYPDLFMKNSLENETNRSELKMQMKSLREIIDNRDAEIVAKNVDIAAKSAEIVALRAKGYKIRNSLSYRIGRIVTAPLRLGKRIFRKRVV
ncbi:MAG: glycosyltransferase [Candidatus Nomurabacteria bacterium]|jgi:glucosyltransferase|nr:glycosyltransferase [Candidatus Nomurabacteria bacterium]